MLLSSKISDFGGKNLEATHTASRLTGMEVSSGNRDILLENCHNTAAINAVSERIGFAGQDRADKIGIALRDSVETNGVANLTSTERNGGEARLIVERTAAETRGLVSNNFTQSQLSAKDIELRLAENKGSLKKQAAEYYGTLRLEVAQSRASVERQAVENYASLQLEACRTKDAIMSKMAECCCELKQKVGETQQLVRELDAGRIRDALTAANTENLILRLSGANCPSNSGGSSSR